MYREMQMKNAVLLADLLLSAQELNVSEAHTRQYADSQDIPSMMSNHSRSAHTVPSILLGSTTIAIPQVVLEPPISVYASAPKYRFVPRENSCYNHRILHQQHQPANESDEFFTNAESDAIERFLDILPDEHASSTKKVKRSNLNSIDSWIEPRMNQFFSLRLLC